MLGDTYLTNLLKQKMTHISVLLGGIRVFLGLVVIGVLILSIELLSFLCSITIATVLSVGSAYLLLRAQAGDQRAADFCRAEAGSISKVDGRVHLRRGQTLAVTMARIASAVASIDPTKTEIQASLSARKNAIASAACMIFIVTMFIYAVVSEHKITTVVEKQIIEFVFTTVAFVALILCFACEGYV